MARLTYLGLVSSVALVAACDDYMDRYPPASPASVEQVPVENEAVQPPDTYADTDPTALTDFHSTLDPHGRWVEDPTYGTVWAPNAAEVGADFEPYKSAGHWAYDDDDYLWVSDYDWGWAPFHYGRWVFTEGGWVWIPGRDYAPAWVSWELGYPGWAYVGWGPMYPTYIWRGGLAVGYVAVAPAAHVNFVASNAVFAPSVGARVVTGPEAGTIAAHAGAYTGGAVATAPAAGGEHTAPGAGGSVATAPAAQVRGAPSASAMHGPSPSTLGIPASAVTHVSPTDKGTMMAKNFARPSTAAAMGAHPPATVARPAVKPSVATRPGYHAPSRSGGFHGGGGGHR